MFFGFFSSLLPYLIAGGFYLVYLIITVAQPALEKIIEKNDKTRETNHIIVEELSEDKRLQSSYFIDDYQEEFIISDYRTGLTLFQDLPDPFSRRLSIKLVDRNFVKGNFKGNKILTELFFRPPPTC